MTVTATDTHGGTDTVDVTIEVQDIDEVGLLGRIVFVVGGSGTDYGYDSGSYGSLTSGSFPRGLFDDDTDRTVSAIYENADAEWVWEYSGGAADDWQSDQDALDAITVTVTYEDDRDTRSFVLGGFVESSGSSNRLTLSPPLPSRDWDSHDTETVAITFTRHAGQAAAIILPPASMAPTATRGSFLAALEDTPGGPVDLQLMLTCIVFAALVLIPKTGGWGVILSTIALVVTPWIPVPFGYGDYYLSTVITVVIACVFFGQKILSQQPR